MNSSLELTMLSSSSILFLYSLVSFKLGKTINKGILWSRGETGQRNRAKSFNFFWTSFEKSFFESCRSYYNL